MNTHDKIELPPHDATANLGGSPPVRLYSEAKVRAAIEADRKRTTGSAKERFYAASGEQEQDPIERLRFYCSIAMSGQDWIDVEPFFDAVTADRQRGGEPVAMRCRDAKTKQWSGYLHYDNEAHESLVEEGFVVQVLYAGRCVAPTSDKPACGAQNVDQATQITELNINYKQLYEQMCDRCGYLDEELAKYTERTAAPVVKESLTVAEPVKSECPSCGIDLVKDSCASVFIGCAMMGVAQNGEESTETSVDTDSDGVAQAAAVTESDYQNLIDCEGIELESSKPFRFACCDCGLVHDVVIVSEDERPVGFSVKRNHTATEERRKEIQPLTARSDLFRGDNAEPVTAQPAASAEPVAWMHDEPGRVDVIHTAVKKLLHDSHEAAGYLHRPLDKSGRYTIPLYAAPVAAQPSVPEGWKLVPIDPTKEMLLQVETPSEYKFEVSAGTENAPVDSETAAEIYCAMLAAAPTPPAAGQTWCPGGLKPSDFPALPECCDAGPRCGNPVCEQDPADRQAQQERQS